MLFHSFSTIYVHVYCLIINANNLHAYTNFKIRIFSVIINILIYNY